MHFIPCQDLNLGMDAVQWRQMTLFFCLVFSINVLLTFFLFFPKATAELAASYAALILADDGIEITVYIFLFSEIL